MSFRAYYMSFRACPGISNNNAGYRLRLGGRNDGKPVIRNIFMKSLYDERIFLCRLYSIARAIAIYCLKYLVNRQHINK